MMCEFVAVPQSELEKMVEDPARLESLLEVEEYEEAGEDSDAAASYRRLQIEQAWHGVQHVLTECAEDHELNAVIFGFIQAGEDLGYGPPGVNSNEQVRSLSDLMNAIPDDLIAQRLTLQSMGPKDLYAVGTYPSQEDAEWVKSAFDQVRDFYNQASAEDCGIVTFIL